MSSRTWETSLTSDIVPRNAQQHIGGHSGVVILLCWSFDNDFLVSACSNCFVKIWRATTYELTHTIEDHRNPGESVQYISAIKWSPDSMRLVTIFNTSVKFWNKEDSFSFLNQLCVKDTKMLEWTKDCKKIVTIKATTTIPNLIHVWDDSSYNLLFKINDAAYISSRTFDLSPDANLIAYSYISYRNDTMCESLAIANISTDTISESICEITVSDVKAISYIYWSPNENIIATTYRNNLRIWKSNPLSLVNIIKSKCENITSFTWSPDGTRFIILSRECSRTRHHFAYMEIYSTQEYKLQHTILCNNNTIDVLWQKNKDYFISKSEDMVIQYWNANSFELLHTTEENSLLFNCSSLSSQENLVAFGGNDRIVIWNIESNTTVATIKFRENIIENLPLELRKCPQCRKEIPSPFGYRGYPDNNITCGICYEDFSPIMMTMCGHFLCEICFRNPLVFGYNNVNLIDELANSMRGISLSPRDEEYVPYNKFRDEFIIYGRYPNPPESRDKNETIRRKDVIINALRKHHNDSKNNRISAQIVMDITFYCDPPREDFPLGFMSPDEQSCYNFRRSICLVKDIPDWQTAIISLYNDLIRR